MRVEAAPMLSYYAFAATGLIGYASAEAIVNLSVLGATSDRRSLARSIAVVLWFAGCEQKEPVRVPLACEFAPGRNRYWAILQIEVWSGGGNGSAKSLAQGYCPSFTVRTAMSS